MIPRMHSSLKFRFVYRHLTYKLVWRGFIIKICLILNLVLKVKVGSNNRESVEVSTISWTVTRYSSEDWKEAFYCDVLKLKEDQSSKQRLFTNFCCVPVCGHFVYPAPRRLQSVCVSICGRNLNYYCLNERFLALWVWRLEIIKE